MFISEHGQIVADFLKEMDLALRSRLYDEKAPRTALPFRRVDIMLTLLLFTIYICYIII